MYHVLPETTKYEHLIYDVIEQVCWLTLNRPEKINAMNERLLAELRAALLRADDDDNVNVIVIRGAGRGFCAGHDLEEGPPSDEGLSMYEYRLKYIRQFEQFTTPWHVSKPVIASAHKFAIGKGFELSLFCDVSIVTSDIRMGYGMLRYGIAGHCMFMPWLVSMKAAKELLLTGREVSGKEAKELGLATEVVVPEQLHEATRRKAMLMARMPRDMQRLHKMYLNRVYEMQGLKSAADYYLELVAIAGMLPEYAEFTKLTADKGLKGALYEMRARYEGLG
ncbi:Enoyl-CoA hydratase/isomerase [Mesorhizobium sp. ORS 3359]|nr:Enoyl-CoA hydratase/isomerase [Mesorhizobium sp. ORS 3359]